MRAWRTAVALVGFVLWLSAADAQAAPARTVTEETSYFVATSQRVETGLTRWCDERDYAYALEPRFNHSAADDPLYVVPGHEMEVCAVQLTLKITRATSAEGRVRFNATLGCSGVGTHNGLRAEVIAGAKSLGQEFADPPDGGHVLCASHPQHRFIFDFEFAKVTLEEGDPFSIHLRPRNPSGPVEYTLRLEKGDHGSHLHVQGLSVHREREEPVPEASLRPEGTSAPAMGLSALVMLVAAVHVAQRRQRP